MYDKLHFSWNLEEVFKVIYLMVCKSYIRPFLDLHFRHCVKTFWVGNVPCLWDRRKEKWGGLLQLMITEESVGTVGIFVCMYCIKNVSNYIYHKHILLSFVLYLHWKCFWFFLKCANKTKIRSIEEETLSDQETRKNEFARLHLISYRTLTTAALGSTMTATASTTKTTPRTEEERVMQNAKQTKNFYAWLTSCFLAQLSPHRQQPISRFVNIGRM